MHAEESEAAAAAAAARWRWLRATPAVAAAIPYQLRRRREIRSGSQRRQVEGNISWPVPRRPRACTL